MRCSTHKTKVGRKAQISLEFLIVTTLVLLTFMVMGFVIYQKYVEWSDLSLNIKGRDITNTVAENINQLVIVGDGFTKRFVLDPRYPGDEFNVTFNRDSPKVIVENKWNWFAPLLTTNVYCCTDICETKCKDLVMNVSENTAMEATNLNSHVYLGPVCSQDTALISYWSFDEGIGSIAYDLWGDNHGVINGSTAWVEGNCSKALSFNAVDSFVSVFDDDDLDFGENENFTVAAWVKTTQSPQPLKYPIILSKENSAFPPKQGYDLVLHNGDVNPEWYFQIWVSNTAYTVFGSKDIADGEWHYIVGIRNGTELLAYEDGSLANTAAGSTGDLSNNNRLRVGKFTHDSYPNNYIGLVDEVKIFNRALTPEEIIRENETAV